MRTNIKTWALSLAAALLLGGCYSPGGGMLHHSSGPVTYLSNNMLQKTITLIDVRTGESVWTSYVPPGKQLVIDFDEGEGHDPVLTPDLMRYEMMDAGTRFGRLQSQLSVPPASARRIEVQLHRGPENAPASAYRQLRADEMVDRPDWWTPQGGDLPGATPPQTYDE